MDDELTMEQELERLQEMHETVERLRSQLKTIKLAAPEAGTELGGGDPQPIQQLDRIERDRPA